jgi:uncharacterized protein
VTTLVDANVLIALMVSDHVHHDAAESWMADHADRIATCPITQGSLIRLMVRQGQAAADATSVLAALAADRRHEFWPDDISYPDMEITGIVGHRQVADAYLAQLARNRSSRLATFDEGLAALHPDVAELLPRS